MGREVAMYMRIVWGKVRQGQWEQYEEAYKRALRPGHEHIRGLTGRWLVRDLDDRDAGYSVSLWESQEAMDRYEASSFFQMKVKPALQPFFVDDFTTTHCEVRVKEEFAH
jgi:heme-degrading monooxygenase HmoA